MNKENAKDYLPLVQALAEGKTIQVKIHDLQGNFLRWEDEDNLNFKVPPYHYRIKPELSQESLAMANYLEEMQKSIREMKIQPHDITNTAIASGCGTYREVTFIYTEKA